MRVLHRLKGQEGIGKEGIYVEGEGEKDEGGIDGK